jgi:hypothetical protein
MHSCGLLPSKSLCWSSFNSHFECRLQNDPAFKAWEQTKQTSGSTAAREQKRGGCQTWRARVAVVLILAAFVASFTALRYDTRAMQQQQQHPHPSPDNTQAPDHATSCGDCAPCGEGERNCVRTQIFVVETSLGLGGFSRILRHLGIRAGSGESYMEAHFGPKGSMIGSKGVLTHGAGSVADSEYLDVIPAGMLLSLDLTGCPHTHKLFFELWPEVYCAVL